MKPEQTSGMTLETNLYLIGPMGAGKSSVGRLLAKRFRAQFMDVDEEIKRRTGVSIPWIFQKEGEEGFRQRESEVIANLSTLKGWVVATGGGSILRTENQTHLKKSGHIIYLRVSLSQQVERATRRPGERPLLSEGDPEETLRQINKIRTPLYEALADLIVDTDNKNPKAVVKIIKDWVMQDKLPNN